MRKLIRLWTAGALACALCVTAIAQNPPGLATRIKSGTSLLGTPCTSSGGNTDFYIQTSVGVFYCKAGIWQQLQDSGGGTGTVTHTAGALTAGQLVVGNGSADITVGNLSGDVTTSGSVSTTIAAGVVTESKIGLSNVTTNDVSTAKHGFAPKAPNDATKFLDGTGNYSTPSSAVIAGGFAWGGDGSDGAVTFDGSSTVLGLVPSSTIYTLTRDIFTSSMVLNSGVTIKTANFRIFCTGTLTVNGTIHNNGSNGNNGATATSGSGGTGGSAPNWTTSNVSGSLSILITSSIGNGNIAGGSGGNGSATVGSVGAKYGGTAPNVSNGIVPGGTGGNTGASGGKGGNGTSSGGAAQTGSAPGTFSAASKPGRYPQAIEGNFSTPGTSVSVFQAPNGSNGGSAGGSGGGGDGSNLGGGGGGAGSNGAPPGAVVICAKVVVVGASGAIQANGGNGGNGGNGFTPTLGNTGGGGGGGGGGGANGTWILIVTQSYSNGGTVQSIGGTHGTHGTGGSGHGTGTAGDPGVDGSDGLTGVVIVVLT